MKSLKVVFLAAAVSLIAAGSALAAESVGRVTDVLGQASVVRAQNGERVSLKTFIPIFQGDQLETGGNGRVKLLFTDDSVLSLSPNTVLKVTEMVFNPKKEERRGFFSLVRGRLRAAVAKYADTIKSKYEISTPTAVAGIRGTTLTMGTGIPGLNDFLALENGNVQWCQGGNCVDITPGAMALIGANGQWIQRAMSQGDIKEYIDPGQMDDQGADYDEGAGGGFEGDPHKLTPEQMQALQQLRDEIRSLPNTDERSVNLEQILSDSTVLNIRLQFPY